ncbi:MAG: hypothetical protein ABL921_05115 [Pirellula sp.]
MGTTRGDCEECQQIMMAATACCRSVSMRGESGRCVIPFPVSLGMRILIRPSTMWRAFFSAIGIVLIIVGIECLLIDSAVLVAGVMDDPSVPVAQQSGGLFGAPITNNSSDRVFRPSDWFPWSMVASGAIVLLYSISLRQNT